MSALDILEGHELHTRFSSHLRAQMTPVGHWYAWVRGRLDILWRHKLVDEETRAHVSRVSFGEILWKFVYFMI